MNTISTIGGLTDEKTSVQKVTMTESYVLGQGGEQLTTLDGSQNWERTNVYGAGQLLATYDAAGLHFQLTAATDRTANRSLAPRYR